jgi:WD40 repeat protein
VLVGRDGEPKVLDFGVARRSGAAVAISTVTTEIGQLVGTVAFMSPEQITAVPSEVDTRSDVYALGVILFRLVTGRLPFTEDNPPLPELARRIAMLDPPRLPPADRSLAGDLETVLLTALAKEKERRYASAADLAADLRRWLADQPIAAAADSAWYLVRRQLVRYRRAAAAAAVAFVALASLAAFALVQRSRAESNAGRLGDELATSNIERARLLGMTSNLRAAEAALWHELFERPDSRHAQWALWELYARQPTLWARVLHPGGASTVLADATSGRLISAGRDGKIRIVDPSTGDVRQTFPDEAPDVFHLGVLPGGTIVSLSTDGALRSWDAAGRIARVDHVGTQPLGMIVAGPDVVALTADHQVQFRSISKGKVLERVSLPDVQPTLLDISPDGGTIVFGTEAGEVIAWDRAARRVRWRTPLHRGRTSALRFAPDGLRVASGGGDQVIGWFDARSGRVVGRVEPANGTVRTLAFDRSGRRLAVAGWWRTVLLEADSTGLREVASFSEPSWRLDLSADGSLLFTCTEAVAGEVRAWQLGADPRLATWTSHTSRVVGLAASGNLPTIATGATDGSIRIRGLSDAAPSITLTHPGPLLGLQFDDAGRHLLTGGRGGELAAWEVDGGRITQTVAGGVLSDAGIPAAGATAFGASPDGSRLAVGHSNGAVSAWRWNGGSFERWFQSPPQDGEALGIVIFGDLIAVTHRDRAAVIHDGRTGRTVHRFPVDAAAFTAAWRADGRQLAVGTWTGAIEVWDLAANARVQSLRVHNRVVSGLNWSEETGLLASASRDGTVRLWDVERGQALATLASRDTGAARVQLLPRQQLLVGWEDGLVEVRDLAYFFRHVAGQAEYQRIVLEAARAAEYARGDAVIEWARRILDVPGR